MVDDGKVPPPLPEGHTSARGPKKSSRPEARPVEPYQDWTDMMLPEKHNEQLWDALSVW